MTDDLRPYIDMLDPADPPDPVDEMKAVLSETLRANDLQLWSASGAHVFNSETALVGLARGLLARKVAEPSRVLDPADPASPLDDLLDAIATREEGGDNRPLGEIVRSWYAALASSPAPAGLEAAVDRDSYIAGWRDSYQRLGGPRHKRRSPCCEAEALRYLEAARAATRPAEDAEEGARE